MTAENDRVSVRSEIDALKETVRVMLGFQTRDEVEEIFRKTIVRKAVSNLEKALEITRARRQPDEFALALAVQMELLTQARASGHDLEALFNDPGHHVAPSPEIASLIEKIWAQEQDA
jgi:hypothetical protein